jgi:hypothetical protein
LRQPSLQRRHPRRGFQVWFDHSMLVWFILFLAFLAPDNAGV